MWLVTNRRKPSLLDRIMVRVIFAILFTVTIAVLILGIGLATSTTFFVLTATKTTGHVVDIHRRNPEDTLAAPIFSFTNNAGTPFVVTQKITTIFHEYPLRAEVPIYYKPSAPHTASIANPTLLYFGPTILVLMGMAGAAFMLFWRFLFHKFENKSSA
jgi:hypothetical protein